jgi:hypothetical protein
MTEPVTYGDLERTLLSFDLVMTETHEGYRLFRHPHSEAVLLLPNCRREKAAQQFHYASVRGTLADFGSLKSDEFDDFVRSHGRAAS